MRGFRFQVVLMFSELRLAWSAGQWMMSAWAMARVNEVHWCTGVLVYWYSKMSIATCNREVKVEIPAMDIRKGRNVSEHQVHVLIREETVAEGALFH